MSKPVIIYVRHSRECGWYWEGDITKDAWVTSLRQWNDEQSTALRSARAFAKRLKVAPKIVVED